MSLDLVKTAGQIDEMVEMLQDREGEWGKRLGKAMDTLMESSDRLDDLQGKIGHSKVTWLVAGLKESPDARYPAPPIPSDYAAVATDGSHIDVDRHGPVRCYLINIGRVVLQYGSRPNALLDSEPYLYTSEDDLVLRDPDSNQEQPIMGGLLGIKRMVEECRALVGLAEQQGNGLPTVALLDGSLIMWGLEGKTQQNYVRKSLLEEGLLKELEAFRRLSDGRNLALASYISFPRSTDVVNALRVAVCPHRPFANCDQHCSGSRVRDGQCPACAADPRGHRECDEVGGITDRNLFQEMLSPGERSAIFVSRSSIVRDHYGEHEVHFFYLNVGEEVARVEIPGWVALRRGLVDLVHAVTLDQCHRGQGYPVAISESHEQAVVTGADREEFWAVVNESMGGRGISSQASAKSLSKQTRWV